MTLHQDINFMFLSCHTNSNPLKLKVWPAGYGNLITSLLYVPQPAQTQLGPCTSVKDTQPELNARIILEIIDSCRDKIDRHYIDSKRVNHGEVMSVKAHDTNTKTHR